MKRAGAIGVWLSLLFVPASWSLAIPTQTPVFYLVPPAILFFYLRKRRLAIGAWASLVVLEGGLFVALLLGIGCAASQPALGMALAYATTLCGIATAAVALWSSVGMERWPLPVPRGPNSPTGASEPVPESSARSADSAEPGASAPASRVNTVLAVVALIAALVAPGLSIPLGVAVVIRTHGTRSAARSIAIAALAMTGLVVLLAAVGLVLYINAPTSA